MLLPLAGAVAGVEAVAELVVSVAVVAGAEAAEELLELELPQPANTSNPTAKAKNDKTGVERIFFAAPVL